MSGDTLVLPLRGGSDGCYRVHITGNSGSGKSTTGKRLASILSVPLISLDTLYWEPGWVEPPPDVFRARVREALSQAPDGWVVEGSYHSRIDDIVSPTCTDIIWLDPPFMLYFPRIVARTFLRMVGLGEPCSPGCPERLSRTFSRRGILWWCMTNHSRFRKRKLAGMESLSKTLGAPRMQRIGGWGNELKAWLLGVMNMARHA
ncbi:AAA domain-containing protein [Infundibulicybe gibba]|nr:AAA domain-containing protein [Infundibulicybe gibba]